MARVALDPAEISPVPADVAYDHSLGHRAIVTYHAVRRYAERHLGVGEELLEGIGDRDAVDALRVMGVPIQEIRDRLAYFGGVGMRRGAHGVCRDGWALKLAGGRVTTVVAHGARS